MATSLFSPPRNKPKLSLSKPTLAVGQPMPMMQTIDRPVNLVDDEGNVHGRLGENPNGPEQVTVTPPPGATNDPAGGPNYASGGTLLIGGGWGLPKEVMPDGGSGSMPPGPGAIYGPPSPNQSYGPPAPSQQYGPPAPQPQMVGGGVTSVPLQTLNPNAQIQQFQQQQLAAKQALLRATGNTLDKRSAAMGAKSGVTDAKRNVLGLQEQQLGMQAGVSQQSQQNDQQRLAELQAMYAASQNIPDLTNVAEAKNLYNAEDRRASQMGVSPAAEVDLPPGANPARLPGVRPKIMSQEDRIREQAGYEDPIRNQQLQLAKDAVELQGTDVKRAQLIADRLGLTLEEMNQMVQEAELNQSRYQLNENQADLDLAGAQQPPFPGAVRSAISGNWLSPEDRDKERIQYQENVTQPYQNQVQGQGSQFAGLSVPQLLNTIPPGLKKAELARLYSEPIRAELIRRFRQQGMNETQAREAADAIIKQEFDSRNRSGGGLTEVVPGQQTTGTPTPAGAPTGQSTVTGPTLPPGYN